MQPIHVIGVGPGDNAYLTQDARSAIHQADLVWCAERHTLLVPPEKLRPLVPFRAAMEAIRNASEQGQKTAVLVSGDTGLYSMLGLMREAFGADALEVHPGISALQLFCARLKTAWQDACILSAHGRALSPSALCHHARTNQKTILFLDAERNPHWVHQTLCAGGLSSVRLTVGEKLGYSDESVAAYENRSYDPLCMVMIENECPVTGLPAVGMPDDAFIRGKVPMTKQSIRVQALAALQLKPDSIVWDIGAGTGSVSIECARQCPLGQVYAIEYKPEAINLIRQNAEQFRLLNIQTLEGRAPEVLSGLPVPDGVFLGGTEGCAEAVLSLLHGFGKPIRVVATAVTMESAWLLMNLLKDEPQFFGVQIAVSQLEAIGHYEMLKAQSPVFLFSAMIGGAA